MCSQHHDGVLVWVAAYKKTHAFRRRSAYHVQRPALPVICNASAAECAPHVWPSRVRAIRPSWPTPAPGAEEMCENNICKRLAPAEPEQLASIDFNKHRRLRSETRTNRTVDVHTAAAASSSSCRPIAPLVHASRADIMSYTACSSRLAGWQNPGLAGCVCEHVRRRLRLWLTCACACVRVTSECIYFHFEWGFRVRTCRANISCSLRRLSTGYKLFWFERTVLTGDVPHT